METDQAKHLPLTDEEEKELREYLAIPRNYEAMTIKVRLAMGLLASLDEARKKANDLAIMVLLQ